MTSSSNPKRAAKSKAGPSAASRAELQEQLRKAANTIAGLRADSEKYQRWWHEDRERLAKRDARVKQLEASLAAIGVLSAEATGKLVAPEPYPDIPF